ncbi:TonB-dependent receptor [Noviherbaspirillum sp. 1P10PC]|uniref:TonB-dependent receptor plug domain-containing protein n=1 Tax=Noviherbaspirillum sp. 1P10PC TaxID=3132292 RepID=UPI0039A24A53
MILFRAKATLLTMNGKSSLESMNLFISAAVASLILQPPAFAAHSPDLTSLSLDQIFNMEIVSASKIAQKVSDVPGSVSVVTAQDIKDYGHRSLADILQSMRGIYISYDRNYSYIGTRGIGRPGDFNTRLLILIDGKRTNDAIYDTGAAGTEFPIDVELIDRVEFVPGPGSAIYGSSAFFGVINVITKSGASFQGGELSTHVASYDTRYGRATFGKKLDNGLDVLVSASGLNSKGPDLYFPEFDSIESNNGVARGLDYDRYKKFFAKVSAGDFTLSGYLSQRTKGIPTASYGQQFNDPRSQTVDEYASLYASYKRELSRTLDLYANLNLNSYRYSGAYIYNAQSDTLNRDLGNAQSLGGELRLVSTGFRNHKVIYGAEYNNSFKREQLNYDINPLYSYLKSNVLKHGSGVYVQDEIRLQENLILNLGIRRDIDAEGGASNNPRVAVIYKATPELAIKGLYGTAFRTANAYERYYATTESLYKINPDLKSEKIRTQELIFEYSPAYNFRTSASLFQYQFKDLISLTTDAADGLLYFSNIDAAKTRGLELEAEWAREGGSRLKTSASFQYANSTGNGEWLTNSPRQIFKLNYTMPFLDKAYRTGLEYQFTSKRKTPIGGEVGGFGIVNVTLVTQKLANKLELSASLYNLLDKRYMASPSEEHFDNSSPPRYLNGIQQNGRNFRVVATYKF